MRHPLVLGVLVSGEGTTLDALAEEIAGGHLPARIGLVVADRPYAGAIERARRRGLPTLVLPFRGEDPARWSARLTSALHEQSVDLVLLAGFLALLPGAWVRDWQGRAINLHPSLLPRFGGRGMYGEKVHRAVLASGETETGVTVHLVTEEIDRGPILEQDRVAVHPGDTADALRERLRPVERRVLFSVLRGFADGRLPLPYPESGARAPSRDRSGTVS